jgi:hypothetical protein
MFALLLEEVVRPFSVKTRWKGKTSFENDERERERGGIDRVRERCE